MKILFYAAMLAVIVFEEAVMLCKSDYTCSDLNGMLFEGSTIATVSFAVILQTLGR